MSDMKKFIIKLIALFATVFTILLGFNQIYKRVRYSDNFSFTEDKFNNVPKAIQISNFGSSHGLLGFDYSDFDEEYITFNFALSAQTLSYDYRILQQYENRFEDGGVIFIPISNFSFSMDEENEYNFLSKNERYYSFMKPEYIKQFNWETFIKKKYFDVVFQDPLSLINIFTKSESEANEEKTLDYGSDASAAYERHIRLDDTGNLVIRQEEVDAVYGMIEICRKHNIRPILITTPFREEYNNCFDKKFYEQFHAVIDRICEDENVEYYDYSHDTRFVRSDEYEMNSDHLTHKGATVFTDILIDELLN